MTSATDVLEELSSKKIFLRLPDFARKMKRLIEGQYFLATVL